MAPVNHDTQVMLMQRASFILANQPHIATLPSAPVQNFTTDLKAPLKECKVYFSPVQSGSGTPSPNNVRPITGWTSLTTYYSGENLYIPNENNKGYIKNNGTIVVDDHSTYTDLIPVVAGDIYSFRCTTLNVNGSTNRRLHGYDSSGNWVSQLKVVTTAKNTTENCNIIVTIPSGISYIRVSFRLGDTNPRVAKENAYEVNWSDSGTVYGGYVDLVRGDVVQIWKELNLSTTKWSYIASTNRFETPYLNDADRTRDLITVISDTYLSVVNQTGASFNTSIGDMAMCFNISSGRPYIVLHDSRFTSAEELIGSFSDHQMFYKLAEPIHYPVDPITLKTLRGTNNIWSSANGPIEVSYWTH